MFEAAELGRKVSSTEYKAQVPALRAELLEEQSRLREVGRSSVIVLFGGVDGAGKSEIVNLLNEWMDPRWLVTRAYGPPSDEERERPEYWRFWRDLPAKGRIGFFLSAWYSRPLVDRVHRRLRRAEFGASLDEIAEFERALTDDGALILKFWMHLDKRSQEQRLEKLHSDPLTRWRVTREQWENWKLYDRFIEAGEEIITRTSLANAPWMIVEGGDERYRSLTVATAIRDAIRKRLTEPNDSRAPVLGAASCAAKAGSGCPRARRAPARAARPSSASSTCRSAPTRSTTRRSSSGCRGGSTGSIAGRSAAACRRSWCSRAGTPPARAEPSGGITAAIDARASQVIPIAAPTEEERAQHYLWRFWRHLARRGRVTIFDRSWYGRLLVERIEGFATEAEWTRASSEINQFESQLVAHGIVLVKYWIHITRDEQLRRFRAPRPLGVQAVEAHRRGLAEPQAVGGLRTRRQRHDRADQHRGRRRGRWSRPTTSGSRG